jgi:hypothetical protein
MTLASLPIHGHLDFCIIKRYMRPVIRRFRDKIAEAVFNGESPKGFPADLVKVARRKLR